MRFFDLHCDTLTMSGLLKKVPLRRNNGHLDFVRLKNTGAIAQCFAIWIPTHRCAQKYGIKDSPWEFYQKAKSLFKEELQKNSDLIAPALKIEDVEQNMKNGLVSAILTIEDSVLLSGSLEKLETLYRDGVRLMTLTWNYENSLGYPNDRDEAKTNLGLKPFGKEAVLRMMDLGIAVDVSHLSDGGFYNVAELSQKMHIPFLASHSCARSLQAHPRNLTDEMLHILGDCGGICGVNFEDSFLPGTENHLTKIADIVRCACYLCNQAGIDAVAIGSDFDGIESNLEMGGYEGLPLLAEALNKKLPASQVEKICYRNAMRFFGASIH
jgi:membrane dipeptidase